MNDKACLTRLELEFSQRFQLQIGGLITPEVLQEWNGCTAEVLRAKITEAFGKFPEPAKETFLRLISSGESLVLDAVSGKEVLSDAKDLFAYIDSDFKNWNADEKGKATEETAVDVYEMKKDATFSQMFGELNSDVRKVCFTQHQIKKFVKKYRNWLRTDGYATLFLFESKGQFFVASVCFFSSDRLHVIVYRLGFGALWLAGYRLRIVVPQVA